MDQPSLTFHPFPRLPFELRHAIWTLAIIPEPRILMIEKKAQYVNGQEDLIFFTPTPIPPALLVNQESRAQASQLYDQRFLSGTEPRYIYVNFEMDTIHITPSALSRVSDDERRHLRRLRLDVSDVQDEIMAISTSITQMSLLKLFEIFSKQPDWRTEGLWARSSDLLDFRDDLFERQYRHVLGWECPTIRLIEPNQTWEVKPGSNELVYFQHADI